MATDIIKNVKIKLRKDDLSSWIKSDPVLNDGELAIVVDSDGNEHIKIGNGLSTFTQLQYLWQSQFSTQSISATNVVSKHIEAESISQGFRTSSTPTSLATGIYTEVSSNFAVVHGIEAAVVAGDDYAFVWNGTNLPGIDQRYTSHGEGSFSINPVNGLSGIYIGDSSLASQIYTKSETSSAILENSSKVMIRKWSEVN